MPAYHLLKCLLLAVLLFGEPGAHSALVENKDCDDISEWFQESNKPKRESDHTTDKVKFREGVILKVNSTGKGRVYKSDDEYKFECRASGGWWFIGPPYSKNWIRFSKTYFKRGQPMQLVPSTGSQVPPGYSLVPSAGYSQ
eukprot:884825_1